MSANDVLSELDSYRTAISAAFEEGFSMGRLDAGLAQAWERSEARQTECAFAYTRMSVGAIVKPWRPDNWLEGEIALTAFVLANPDCDVRAVLAGFAALVRTATLETATTSERGGA